ncbi:hypothetical protein EMCRGX_G027696 [Ephydatia muelleri]
MKKHAQEMLLSLWKRRGFLSGARSSEGWTYSYGPLGAELKRNLINDWWNAVVTTSGNIQGLDTPIVSPSSTHKTEGKLNCNHPNVALPDARELQAPREEPNKTSTASSRVSEEATASNVLRDCILQGMLQQRVSVGRSFGMKVPFGIAEVGRVFKSVQPAVKPIPSLHDENRGNTIEPYLHRAEQDQAGVVFISSTKEGREWYAHWQRNRLRWWKKLAHNPGALILKETSKQDVPLSTLQCSTIQYNSTWGPILLETIVNHGECSTGVVTIGNNNTAGQGQASVTQAEGCGGAEPNPQLLSCVAEVDNGTLALLCDSYTEAKRPYGPGTDLVDSKITRLHRRLAPYKVAVLPAKENHKLHLYCQMLTDELRHSGISTVYDSSDTLEQRLVIQDEAGTPYRVIADESSLETGIVSLQDRDTTASEDMNGQDVLLTLQRMTFGVHVM